MRTLRPLSLLAALSLTLGCQDTLDAPPPREFNEIHLGADASERGFNIDELTPDQREALPVSALPGDWERTARNAECPCQSGKKFKHCHGALG